MVWYHTIPYNHFLIAEIYKKQALKIKQHTVNARLAGH